MERVDEAAKEVVLEPERTVTEDLAVDVVFASDPYAGISARG